MCFLQPHSTPFINDSTLCLPNMAFTPQSTLSLPTQLEHIYFPDLAQLKDLLLSMQLKPRKGVIAIDTPQINSSPQQLRYLVVYTTYQCVFTRLCQCHLELERDKMPSSFYLGHFSSSKSFDHITKDVRVFHLKSSNSRRLNYFLTSHPFKTHLPSPWPIYYKPLVFDI